MIKFYIFILLTKSYYFYNNKSWSNNESHIDEW